MVWTKLPRSVVHRGVKLAGDNAAFRERFLRAQDAELRRAQKRADAAALDLLGARLEFKHAFLAACIALDEVESARELIDEVPDEVES